MFHSFFKMFDGWGATAFVAPGAAEEASRCRRFDRKKRWIEPACPACRVVHGTRFEAFSPALWGMTP